MGPQLGNNLLNLGIEDAARAALGRARPRPRRAAGVRGGARARQRRPRPARRVLHRLAGDARAPGDRLRHPLRVRHLRAGDPRRLAGREDRQVAALRQPVGDRAARRQLRGEVRRPHRALRRRRAAATACAGCRSSVVKGVAYDTPILGYRVQHLQHAALWRARGRRVVRLRRLQHRRLLRRRRARRSPRRTSPRCSIRTTSRMRASELRLRAAVLLRVLLAAGHAAHHDDVADVPLERLPRASSPSSSTTRIPSIAVAELMRLLVDEHALDWDEAWDITRAHVRATRTTRCCPRRWRSGRCRCSASCCRATSRSSTRSTAASSTRCARSSPATTTRVARACR